MIIPFVEEASPTKVQIEAATFIQFSFLEDLRNTPEKMGKVRSASLNIVTCTHHRFLVFFSTIFSGTVSNAFHGVKTFGHHNSLSLHFQYDCLEYVNARMLWLLLNVGYDC